MKSFKRFINEIHSIEPTKFDLKKEDTLSEINKNLYLVLASGFTHVSEAITKIKKILSMYGIEIGEQNITDQESGGFEIPVSKFESSGENHHNVTGPFQENTKKWILKFNYKLTNGMYYCTSKLIRR